MVSPEAHIDTSRKKLLESFAITYLTAALATVLTLTTVNTWYPVLAKPVFTPPDWVFGVVWPVLYTMMAYSFYLIWNSSERSKHRQRGLKLYIAQLFFNGIWSGAFFTLKSPFLGLLVLGALWITLVANMLEFDRVSRKASLLLIPYLAWTSFAAMLNLAVYLLN